MLGEKVEGVADGGGGRVVAGKEEEFDLRSGEVQENTVDGGEDGGGGWVFRIRGIGLDGGEVAVESEVDDGFTVLGGRIGAAGGEVVLEFGADVAVHYAGIAAVDEGPDGIIARKGVGFDAEGEPFGLPVKSRDHFVFGALRIEFGVAVGKASAVGKIAAVVRRMYNITLPMMSIVILTVTRSS